MSKQVENYKSLTDTDGQIYRLVPEMELINLIETLRIFNELDKIPTGSQLRALREEKGISQRALSKFTGITQAQICRIEKEEVKPHKSTLLNILRTLRKLFMKLRFSKFDFQP